MVLTEGLPTQVTPRWRDAVVVIAGLELRQRIRATRWRISLLVVFGVLSLVILGSLYLTSAMSDDHSEWSQHLFTMTIALVLFLGVIISPTLSATSINGDRRDATLATVQATPITHWQLATGKLLGSWLASMTLLLVAAPYLVWGMVNSPYGVGRCLLAILTVAVIFACYCGIGLGFSAMTARPAGSAIMTQGAVLFLLLGLPAVFGILVPAVSERHQVTAVSFGESGYHTGSSALRECTEVQHSREYTHTERTWWLLAPNPVLIVADIMATPPDPERSGYSDDGPVEILSEAQSWARSGPFIDHETCASVTGMDSGTAFTDRRRREKAHHTGFVGQNWYFGLAANLALGAGGFLLAARRLRVPAGPLPRGVRIA